MITKSHQFFTVHVIDVCYIGLYRLSLNIIHIYITPFIRGRRAFVACFTAGRLSTEHQQTKQHKNPIADYSYVVYIASGRRSFWAVAGFDIYFMASIVQVAYLVHSTQRAEHVKQRELQTNCFLKCCPAPLINLD